MKTSQFWREAARLADDAKAHASGTEWVKLLDAETVFTRLANEAERQEREKGTT